MGHPASKLLSVRATRITQRARPNFIRILLRDRVSRKKTGQRQSAEKHLLGDTMTPAAKAALIFLALTAGLKLSSATTCFTLRCQDIRYRLRVVTSAPPRSSIGR